jgi:tetratricopeptide (TPR) repeat protein
VLWIACVLAASAPLDDAETALAAFDAETALTKLSEARDTGPFALEDHARYYAALGIANAYLEREEQSLDAFVRLLRIAPGHAIAYTLAPRVTFLFERARKVAGPPPSLDFSWPRGKRTDETLPVIVEVLRDPDRTVQRAELRWRDGSAGPFATAKIELLAVGRYTTFELPAFGPEVTEDRTRELYLSAFDAAGDEHLRLGSADAPMKVTQRYVAPTPWHSNWWVWAAIGTAVAAGTATAVYVATRPEPETINLGVAVRRP